MSISLPIILRYIFTQNSNIDKPFSKKNDFTQNNNI